MPDHATKQTDQSAKTDRTTDKVEELPQKPISDRDADSVKGGSARLDELPKES